MTDEDPQPQTRDARELFTKAIELPESQRAAWLRDHCAGNADLEQEMLSLLRHHDAGEGPLAEGIAPRIFGSTRGGSSTRRLYVRCPHCRHPIELSDECEISELVCEACGSSFSLLANEETKSVSLTSGSVDRFSLIEKV
ncbi:MAG: hypothetical protein AAGJ83_08310, partial [Planctomycetota bacterium]